MALFVTYLLPAVIFAIVAYLFWRIPKWQLAKHRAALAIDRVVELENDSRRTLGQVVGGFALVIGFYFTWQQLASTRETLRLGQLAQVSARLSSSLQGLSGTEMYMRVGGLYGLRQVAQQSPEEREVVYRVLTAFIRTKRPIPPDRRRVTSLSSAASFGPAPGRKDVCALNQDSCEDVRTALAILATRNRWARESSGDATQLDLQRTDVSGLEMADAFFPRALLTRARLAMIELPNADFSNAQMEGAELEDANLSGAVFENANLQHAVLRRVRLTGARMRGVDLRNAVVEEVAFEGALLVEADLRNADLRDARQLTSASVAGAKMDANTRLPSGISVK